MGGAVFAVDAAGFGFRGVGPGGGEVARGVGEDAGIELENFRFCLEALLSGAPFAGARAELVSLPGTDLRVSYLEVDDGRPDD